MSHLTSLSKHIPDLRTRRILDLGCGRGSFLIELYKNGIRNAVGLEYSAGYIIEAQKRAVEAGAEVSIKLGTGETIPFPDNSFDFVNLAEVIEHVQDPVQVMKEVHRVLTPNGKVYVSVPNRFGFKDQHYHLYFINWLPRPLAELIISLLGKQKNDTSAGLQRLSEMHYMMFSQAKNLFTQCGFSAIDSREGRLPDFIYKPVKTFYLDAFHFILTKL